MSRPARSSVDRTTLALKEQVFRLGERTGGTGPVFVEEYNETPTTIVPGLQYRLRYAPVSQARVRFFEGPARQGLDRFTLSGVDLYVDVDNPVQDAVAAVLVDYTRDAAKPLVFDRPDTDPDEVPPVRRRVTAEELGRLEEEG